MPSVLIVEDHWVWASAVEAQLVQIPQVEVIGVGASADEGIALAEQHHPDVALIDLLLGNDSGLRVTRVLRSRGLTTSMAIITTDPTPWAVAEAREIGVQGFVSKDDLLNRDQLTQVVFDLVGGQTVISPSVRVFDAEAGLAYGLTPQEAEIIRCWADGWGTAEIAARLCVGRQTIRNKTSAIGRKLGVSGRLEIVAKARAERIVRAHGDSLV